jgi:PAS domain S-box-containing protein
MVTTHERCRIRFIKPGRHRPPWSLNEADNVIEVTDCLASLRLLFLLRAIQQFACIHPGLQDLRSFTMETIHFFVQVQLMVTLFLVTLLWSFHNRLRKQEFFRLWAWAWTSFAVFLGLAVLSQWLSPQVASIKDLVVLVAVMAGFLQIPLLVFGAWSLQTQKICPKRRLRLGVGLALAAGIVSVAVSRTISGSVLASFAVRSAPRTLALAAALLFCAWVFLRQWRAERTWAAAVTAGGCVLYAVNQGLYGAVFITHLAFGPRAAGFTALAILLQPRWLFLDVTYTCGICLGLVLLLLEEHQRIETAMLKSSVGTDAIARTNVALQAEIAERKRAEEALRRSEEQYRRVVDHLHDALMIDDAAGHVVFATDRFLQLFGIDREELHTINLEDYVAPEWRVGLRELHDRRVRGESVPERFEYQGIRRNGQRIWLEVNVVSIRDGASKVTHTQSAIRDITDRKRAEEALQASEERHRQLIESANDWVWEVDANVVYTYVSPQCRQILGYEPEEIIGKTPFDLMPPEEARRIAAVFGRIGAERKPFRGLENVNRHKDGHLVTLETNGLPVIDQEGTFRGYRGMDRDITERRQADEARSRLAAIVESSDDAILSQDLDGIILSWNAGAQHTFGYTEAEAVGQPITMLIPPELRDDESKIRQRTRAGKSTEHYETVRITKYGKRVNVSLTISPVRDSADRIVGASKIARDITERKRAEEALRESERRFRLVANTAPVLIWMSGPDKLCNYFNQSWLEFTGRPIEAELGNGWAEGVHPEDLKPCLETYTKAFDRRESFQMQYRLRRHDGEYRWILDTGVPRFNGDGSFAGYIGSCVDVTERKLAEEALSGLSRKLIEAHEEERTWIARELHDDVNQRIALLAIELGRFERDFPDAPAEACRHIEEAQKHLSDLGMDIQALSHRLHSSKLEYLGIVAAARSFCKELSEQQKVEVEFSTADIPQNLPQEVSLCLFRVLQEALQNAVKHSRVGHFTVQLRGAQDEVELVVSDSGVGFNPDAAMSGRGLGVISMQERLHLVKGELSIESKPNCGTTIRARVPFSWESRSMRAAG